MPHDPVLLAETKAWLTRAASDLLAAAVDVEVSPPLLEDALFHSQQAIEKSFKAFLTFHNIPFRRTHSLEELGETLLAIEPSLSGLVNEAVPLTEYAWLYRYPGESPNPTMQEVESARRVAQSVFSSVLLHLPPEIRP